jgi:hypothetical protein
MMRGERREGVWYVRVRDTYFSQSRSALWGGGGAVMMMMVVEVVIVGVGVTECSRHLEGTYLTDEKS